jgi:trk system potassium uptake protein TrkH
VESRYWEKPWEVVFYVVSAVTSAGAGTMLQLSDVSDVFITTLTFLMISGAAYGSTTGGIKIWRLVILGKALKREIKRPFYPTKTVLPVMIEKRIIPDEMVYQVAMYVLLYLGIGVAGSFVFMLYGYSAIDGIFTVFSAQGNVGLNAMPADLYFGMPVFLKIQLIFHMLIGRIEIFPLLYLFHWMRD